MAVRGVITALAWLGIAQHAFVPGDHRGAASYLGLSAQEGTKLLEALPSLRRAAGRANVEVAR